MLQKMLSFGVVVAIVAAVMAFSGAARAAESPSELLEKGIYTEETVGDLDAAVKLYEQAVAEAKKTEAVAAKAQYRLGLCLLKQGKKEQGIAALEEVGRRFPDQKELVAAARKHLPARPGLKLRPPMWGDGESFQYRHRVGRRDWKSAPLSIRSNRPRSTARRYGGSARGHPPPAGNRQPRRRRPRAR